jgi:hypothetical protein
MELRADGDYTERQQALVEHMLLAIKGELEKVEAPPEIVEQLTGSIGFAVTALIDGVASATYNGAELNPHLAFPVGQRQMLYAGGNSWMHEYVYRILPRLFRAA